MNACRSRSVPGADRRRSVPRLAQAAFVVCTALSLCQAAYAQEEIRRKDAGFTLSAGYVQGLDYTEAISKFWQTKGYRVTDAGFFGHVETGVEFRVMDELYLNPRLRWMMTWMKRNATAGYLPPHGDPEVNSVLLPGVAAKYFTPPIGHHFFYAVGFFSGVLAFTGQGDLTLSSEKVEVGYGAGYQYVTHGNGFGVEFAYSFIPVKVPLVYEANFGGLEVSLTYFFTIAKDEPPPGIRPVGGR